MSTMDWEIQRHHSGSQPEELVDRVAVEYPLEIKVNGIPLAALMRLPGMDKELAVGFCLTEKVIERASQINMLVHCGQLEQEMGRDEARKEGELDRGNTVEIETESRINRDRFSATYVVRTGCGGADLAAVDDYNEDMITSELKLKEEVIYEIGEGLTRSQDVFHRTGGTHGAGIFDARGVAKVVAEDVGRHNALDKVVGWCALHGVGMEDKLLALSGRISYEMALKAVRVRIPVVVSMAAPTSLGLRVASAAGLTVVGFADKKRFNVYTHPWRILT
jgi:FdhD protein